MQSRDESERVVSTSRVEDLSSVMGLQDLRNKIEAAEKQGAVSHTIARLPERGKHFLLGGLEWEVGFVDAKRGKLHAKIVEGPGVGEVAGEFGEITVDLHMLCVSLACQMVKENGIEVKGGDLTHHISWVSSEDAIDFAMPAGKVVRVTVEFVDEKEITPHE